MPTHISPDFLWCHILITRLPTPTHISPDFLWCMPYTDHQTDYAYTHITGLPACHILITRLTMPTHISPDFLWSHILITRLTMPTHISPDFLWCMPYTDHQTDYAYTHITRLPVVHAIYWSPDWLCLHTYHQTSCILWTLSDNKVYIILSHRILSYLILAFN